MGENKFYDRYDICNSDFAYKHFNDRSENNFYLINQNKRQLHRVRSVVINDEYAAPPKFDDILMHELLYLYGSQYVSQRYKRRANLYQIELRRIKNSKINFSCSRSTFQTTYRYDIWDNRDIWNDLIPAQRMCFFR